jgi:hypothetical protein
MRRFIEDWLLPLALPLLGGEMQRTICSFIAFSVLLAACITHDFLNRPIMKIGE